jgi:DNA-binding MarR family transcriptional regulator
METNEKLLSSIFDLGRLIRQKMFLNKCFCDLSHSEIEVLFFLKENGISTMKSISNHMRIKPSSATPTIEKLCKKDMLKRIADKRDRRMVFISLTKPGLKEIKKKHRQIRKNLKNIFESLSKKNKKELIKIVNIIIKNHE